MFQRAHDLRPAAAGFAALAAAILLAYALSV